MLNTAHGPHRSEGTMERGTSHTRMTLARNKASLRLGFGSKVFGFRIFGLGPLVWKLWFGMFGSGYVVSGLDYPSLRCT